MTGDDTLKPRDDNRGQAYSLEGLTASLLVIAAVAFALNATAITPLTASTSNKQIQEQNRILGDDLLDTAASNGTLTPLLLNYNDVKGKFKGASQYRYVSEPPTTFGSTLSETLGDESYAYNIYALYETEDGEQRSTQVVYQGKPSEHASAATRTVVLYDDMTLTGTNTELNETTGFYAPDAYPTSPVYNVVQVKIVIWKM